MLKMSLGVPGTSLLVRHSNSRRQRGQWRVRVVLYSCSFSFQGALTAEGRKPQTTIFPRFFHLENGFLFFNFFYLQGGSKSLTVFVLLLYRQARSRDSGIFWSICPTLWGMRSSNFLIPLCSALDRGYGATFLNSIDSRTTSWLPTFLISSRGSHSLVVSSSAF